MEAFYERLLFALRRSAVRDGRWTLLECARAWDDNPSSDNVIVFAWEGSGSERMVAAVNYAGSQSQCYVRVPFQELAGQPVRFKDLMSSASYDRSGSDVVSKGLYLDLPPWGYHVFDVRAV
jgi:hypothetical protein